MVPPDRASGLLSEQFGRVEEIRPLEKHHFRAHRAQTREGIGERRLDIPGYAGLGASVVPLLAPGTVGARRGGASKFDV